MSGAQRITVRGAGRGTRVTLVVTNPRDVSLIVSQGAAQIAYAFGDIGDLRLIEATSGDDWDCPTVWLGRTAVSVPTGSFEVLSKRRTGLPEHHLPEGFAHCSSASVLLKGNTDLVAQVDP